MINIIFFGILARAGDVVQYGIAASVISAAETPKASSEPEKSR
jgi:hypothetical protein